jgi:hypothetical protein
MMLLSSQWLLAKCSYEVAQRCTLIVIWTAQTLKCQWTCIANSNTPTLLVSVSWNLLLTTPHQKGECFLPSGCESEPWTCRFSVWTHACAPVLTPRSHAVSSFHRMCGTTDCTEFTVHWEYFCSHCWHVQQHIPPRADPPPLDTERPGVSSLTRLLAAECTKATSAFSRFTSSPHQPRQAAASERRMHAWLACMRARARGAGAAEPEVRTRWAEGWWCRCRTTGRCHGALCSGT